ncbi:MAG TPA: hypothetical protein VH583_09255 [Vicinamibacterales bacterium]|jgi:peptidoglycan/LPS O-acetylase OafA/YrhL
MSNAGAWSAAQKGARITELDRLRGIAVLAVCALHLAPEWPAALSWRFLESPLLHRAASRSVDVVMVSAQPVQDMG